LASTAFTSWSTVSYQRIEQLAFESGSMIRTIAECSRTIEGVNEQNGVPVPYSEIKPSVTPFAMFCKSYMQCLVCSCVGLFSDSRNGHQ
jgi:hypothetical protein